MKKIVCNKLKGLIVENNFNYSTIAKTIGKSSANVTEKINGKLDWSYIECLLISNLFNMTIEEVFSEITEAYSKVKTKNDKISSEIVNKILKSLADSKLAQ